MIELRLTEPTLTDGMLLSLSSANPGYRFERSPEGKLIVAPSGLFTSGGEGELFAQVLAYARSTKSGRAFPATGGFTLPDTSVVAPDATIVSNERLAALVPSDMEIAYVRLVPDVVFELLSPTDDERDLERKLERYVANGVRTAVLITPASVTLRRADGSMRTLAATTVEVGDAMPGFVLDVPAIVEASRQP